MTTRIEIFHTPGCGACDASQEQLRRVALELVSDLDWRELNVLDQLDYAVELGVISLPSVAIDGKLVFTSMPTAMQLRAALIERTGSAA